MDLNVEGSPSKDFPALRSLTVCAKSGIFRWDFLGNENGGDVEIRTLGALLLRRSPSARLRPLGHVSAKTRSLLYTRCAVWGRGQYAPPSRHSPAANRSKADIPSASRLNTALSCSTCSKTHPTSARSIASTALPRRPEAARGGPSGSAAGSGGPDGSRFRKTPRSRGRAGIRDRRTARRCVPGRSRGGPSRAWGG